MAVLLVLTLPPPVLRGAEQPAGPAELAALEHEIMLLADARRDLQRTLDGEHASECELLTQTAWQLLRDWQEPAPVAPTAAFPETYLAAWRSHSGFSPLQPLDGWQRAWGALRQRERPLADRDEALAVAQHRLERLRDRLSRQLQHPLPESPPAAAPVSAWSPPQPANLPP